MMWSPNLEEDICLSNGLRPTFEQYAQQNSYGLARFKPKTVNSNLHLIRRDAPSFIADARAELKQTSNRKKLGYPNKNTGSRKWHEHQEEIVDLEITNILRSAGLEREPSLYYRPSSKTTFKSAIPIDKFPVVGVKNLHLSPDHFKFRYPYFKNKESSEWNKTFNADKNVIISNGGCTVHRKSEAEPVIDVSEV